MIKYFVLGKRESEEGESTKEGRTKQHLSKKKSWSIIEPAYTTVSIQGKQIVGTVNNYTIYHLPGFLNPYPLAIHRNHCATQGRIISTIWILNIF